MEKAGGIPCPAFFSVKFSLAELKRSKSLMFSQQTDQLCMDRSGRQRATLLVSASAVFFISLLTGSFSICITSTMFLTR